MDQHQRDLRSAATRAFMESLSQLQETLQTAEEQAEPATASPEPTEPNQSETDISFDLDNLEQAIADIEEFIQAKRQSRE